MNNDLYKSKRMLYAKAVHKTLHEMNVKYFLVLFAVPVITVILTYLSHYLLNYKNVIEVRSYDPLFEDLIAVDERQYDVRQISSPISAPSSNVVLSSLNAALEYQILKQSEETTFIPKAEYNSVSEIEVQNSLHAALAFKLMGKNEKALRLFEHAAAIAPNNPDVLNYYGEFIEQTHKDIITADQLYYKVLVQCPDHKGALVNRQRTADVVEQLDLKLLKIIDEKRDILKNVPDSDAFQTVKKQVYYLHVYHTVGIEGNTMSLEQLIYLLETGQAVAGKSIIEHNEILGLQLAMKYVKLLTRIHFITVNEILGIHRRVMGHVDPLSSGVLRDNQVFVGGHMPPPPQQISRLMEEYVEWLNSEEAHNMHPVRYAALAHYKLVDIHPFKDGNGRTSRLIMNLILLRSGYPPVLILKEHRRQYYDNLKIANRGDVRPFVRFIAQCTDQVLDLYLWGIQEFAKLPDIEAMPSQSITMFDEQI